MISWRQIFLNNVGLKGVSILLATIIWFQVASQQVVRRTISLPVELVNLPPRLAIANDYIDRVRADVEVRRNVNIDDLNLSVVINLRGATPERRIERLLDKTVRNKPTTLEIKAFNPPNIELEVEPIETIFVAVVPDVTGSPSLNFEVTETIVIPTQVRVEGPGSALRDFTQVKTGPINVDGLSESLHRRVNLFVSDGRVRLLDTLDVEVWIQIEEKRQEVELLKVPVQVFPPDPSLRLSRPTVRVVGSVPVSLPLDKLNGSEFVAMISTEGIDLTSSQAELTPEVIVPDAYVKVFRVLRVDPVRVRKR